ncbi:MAG: glycerol-3-phosphate acyltransferase [Bacteroidia bacterium]|nr:glycerol-3-phosphate acyltransferase [Bacteroidia bacterium]
MDFIQIVFCTICAYLIGSIPCGIWIGKIFYGIDIRDHGTGTACHINISRIMGPNSSLIVRVLDTVKGFMAANLAFFVYNRYGIFAELEYPVLTLSFGLAAVMGHIFPAFARYRGGKGFHVTLGVLGAVNPVATAVFALIALIIFLASRYPILGYVAAGLALPVFVIATRGAYGYMLVPMYVFATAIFIMLFMTHRQDLLGIIHGKILPQDHLWPPFRRRI